MLYNLYMTEKKFSFVLPAELAKGDDGEWKIRGLASTPSRDLQGEVIDPKGLDLTPIDMKKGIFNWDHKKGPENTIGVIDAYKKNGEGLWLEGRLFKNHSKAKAVHEIMSSLNKADTGRMGMSVEGVIKERAGKDGKTIKKAVIHSCALTMNPVNTDTYASLIKSMTEVEFEPDAVDPVSNDIDNPLTSNDANTADQPMFSTNQVMAIVEKALATGAGAMAAPADKTGGDALGMSNMSEDDKKKKKKKDEVEKMCDYTTKSLKKLSFDLYKSNMINLLDSLQRLYPESSRSEIWEAVRDRMEKKFPGIKDV